jgi:hypothetical protein
MEFLTAERRGVNGTLEPLLCVVGAGQPLRGAVILHVRPAGIRNRLDLAGLYALGAELEPRLSFGLGFLPTERTAVLPWPLVLVPCPDLHLIRIAWTFIPRAAPRKSVETKSTFT